MDKSLEAKCHDWEENYWWFVARRGMLLRLARRLNRNFKILEIGCSGGMLVQELKKMGFKDVYGIDISREAIGLCKKKGISNVYVMDGAKLKFPDGMFDVVLSSDCLEHIKDENSALSEWNRVLRQGGKLIAFAPAYNFLWSVIDEINHHYRRYSKSQLLKALRKNNFRVERSSYWNFSLFLPVSMDRIFERLVSKAKIADKDELFGVGNASNKLLIWLLKFENRLLDFLNFPFGISVFAVAAKIK